MKNLFLTGLLLVSTLLVQAQTVKVVVDQSSLKTVNGVSLFGTGDIVTGGGGAATTDASQLTSGKLPDARLNAVGTASSYTGFLTGLTVDAYGRVVSAAAAATIAESQVAGLVADLSGKVPTSRQLSISVGGQTITNDLTGNPTYSFSATSGITNVASYSAMQGMLAAQAGKPTQFVVAADETTLDQTTGQPLRVTYWFDGNSLLYAPYARADGSVSSVGTNVIPTFAQLRSTITDSLAAAAISYSGDFVRVGNQIRLATTTGATVDQGIVASSPNPVAGGAVQTALAGKASTSHNHVAADVQNFSASVLSSLTALSGYGPGTVLGAGGVWVSATSGSALPQLASSTITTGSFSSSTVTLNWTTVPNAATYVVTQAIDPQFSNGAYDAYTGSALTTTINGLSAGTPYYYRIKAKASGYADSDYGFNSFTTSGASLPTLGTPVVTLGSATTSTLAASWPAVTNATSYSVAYATNSGFTTGLVSLTQAGVNYTLTGLSPATTYYVRVAAVATGYNASAYGTANATTSAPAGTTALTAPTLAMSGVGSTSAVASWGSVANSNGYSLDRATNTGFSTGLSTIYTGTALTYTDAALSASTTYYYRVKATGTGSYTDSPYATTQTITTAAGAGGSTTALAGTGIYANGVTTTTAGASWTMVPNVTSYQLQAATDAGFTSIVATVSNLTAAYGQITGLTPNLTYYLRVKAVGSGSYTDGPYSSALQVTTTASGGTYTVERTVKVNFSTSSNATAVATWNTLSPTSASIVPGYVSSTFVDATGASTPFSLSLGNGVSGGGVNYFNGAGSVPVSVWPALVMNRGWTYAQTGGTIRIQGLQAGKFYQIYTLSANIASDTQLYYSIMTAGGVTGGIHYIPGNGTDSSPGETSGPSLGIVNNLTTSTGYIDVVISRRSGDSSNKPIMGFILQESSVAK